MLIVGQKLASLFGQISFSYLIGKSTYDIDLYIADLMYKFGLKSCCKGYKKYPGSSCISVNNELVHGVPSLEKIIKETDKVTIDICVSYNNFCADAARTYAFFENNSLYKAMHECANNSLNAGINEFKSYNTIKSISRAIEKVINNAGYDVVRDFCGHGIGRLMHEDPYVPNYDDVEDENDQKIYVGMALAIEPMFCQYSSALVIDETDGWTAVTKDGGLAMHVEDTVLLDDTGCVITTRLQ